MPSASRTPDFFGDDALPEGFRYRSDFLSGGEERSLLEQIKVLPFRDFEFHGFTGKRRIVSFGWRYDFNGGGLTKTDDMPEFLFEIRERAEKFAAMRLGELQQVLITNIFPALLSAGTRIALCSAMWSAFRFFPLAPSVCA